MSSSTVDHGAHIAKKDGDTSANNDIAIQQRRRCLLNSSSPSYRLYNGRKMMQQNMRQRNSLNNSSSESISNSNKDYEEDIESSFQSSHRDLPIIKSLVSGKNEIIDDKESDRNTSNKIQTIGPFLLRDFLCLDKFLDKLFDSADTNKDGSISISEFYELILCMFIRINRQAPILPPSRNKINKMFSSVDIARKGDTEVVDNIHQQKLRLNRCEFKQLAFVLASHSIIRVITYKFIKYVIAPVLAVVVVEKTSASNFSYIRLARHTVEVYLPAYANSILLEKDFWKTAVTVVFVSTLGNVVLFILDMMLSFDVVFYRCLGRYRNRGGRNSRRNATDGDYKVI